MHQCGKSRPAVHCSAVERDSYAEADVNSVRQMTSDDLEAIYVSGAGVETVNEIDSTVDWRR
jgi:hypothetical protein